MSGSAQTPLVLTEYPQQSVFNTVNASVGATASGGNLTVSLFDQNGHAPSSQSIAYIGFRANILTSGVYTQTQVITATSLSLASGFGIGITGGTSNNLVHVYALSVSGTAVLAVLFGAPIDETGLVSSTALASGAGVSGTLYAAGAYTNVPARYLGRFYVTTGSGTANYQLVTKVSTLPLPTATQLTAGITGPGVVPIGAVIPVMASLAGSYAPTNTTVSDSNGYVLCQGQTLADSASPLNGQVIPNLTGNMFLAGATGSGATGGAATVTLSTGNLPSHQHSASGLSAGTSISGGTYNLVGSTTFAAAGHTHTMGSHTHAGQGNLYAEVGMSSSNGHIQIGTYFSVPSWTTQRIFNTSSYGGITSTPVDTETNGILVGGTTAGPSTNTTSSESADASIGLSGTTPTASTSISGNTGLTGSGTSFSILPTYMNVVYVMRVK